MVTCNYPGASAGRRGYRRGTDRAAGQRRRRYAVHVVAVRQRRLLHPDRHLRSRQRRQHGPGHGADYESRQSAPSRPPAPIRMASMADTMSANQLSVPSGASIVGRGQGSPKRPVCCSSLHRMYPPFVAQAGKVAGRGTSKHAPASSSRRTRTHPFSFSTTATCSGEARSRSHRTSRSCQARSCGRSGQPVRSMICGPALEYRKNEGDAVQTVDAGRKVQLTSNRIKLRIKANTEAEGDSRMSLRDKAAVPRDDLSVLIRYIRQGEKV